jgi:hypothetical protein
MTVMGNLESRINAGSYTSGEMYITIINTLNRMSSLGITRIASNYGTAGTGFNYWDVGPTIGLNSWVVYRFANATIPFYMLIQCVIPNTTNSTSIGTPGAGSISTNWGGLTSYGVAFAVSMRLDGLSPWNGTTNNNGIDTKGTPVWIPGASTLCAFPRVNSVGGTYATNREAITPIIDQSISTGQPYPSSAYNQRMNIIVDENNFLILLDSDINGSYSWFYFGKYVPRPDLNIQVPYVMLSQMHAGLDPIVARYNYGLATVPTSFQWLSTGDGGIVHPTASTGVKIVYTDTSSTHMSTTYNPNRSTGVIGRYDLLPVYVLMSELNYTGLLGSIDFFRVGYGLGCQTTSNDRRLAVFGTAYPTSGKIVVPWDGSTSPGSGINRIGVAF